MKHLLCLSALCGVFSLLSAHAETYRVGHGGGYDFNRIVTAIEAAQAGDTLLIADGNYSAASGEVFPLLLWKPVSLKAEVEGTRPRIVGDGNHTVLSLKGFRDYNVIIEGLEVTGGGTKFADPNVTMGGAVSIEDVNCILDRCFILNNQGGGIGCKGSSPRFLHCLFEGNTGDVGGGIYAYWGSPQFLSCTFRQNSNEEFWGNGGGGFFDNCQTTIISSEFQANSAGTGGGLFFVGGFGANISRIINCSFQENLAKGDFSNGGAIATMFDAIELTNCTIDGNLAGTGGGGLFLNGWTNPPSLIDRCKFRNNSVTDPFGAGGGILADTTGDDVILNCQFYNNTATSGGGAVACHFGDEYFPVVLKNCVLWENKVTEDFGGGGGLSVSLGSSAKLVNCTLSGNQCTGLYSQGGGVSFFGYKLEAINTIVYGNFPDEVHPSNARNALTFCDVLGGYPGQGNIDADPLFVDAANGDYHLNIDSPCINAGSLDEDTPSFDFDNEPRPDPDSGLADIGADEYYAEPAPTITPGPSPTPTPTSADTPTPTPTPEFQPSILLAGYWTSYLSQTQPGTIQMVALASDTEGVDILIEGSPTGLTLPAWQEEGMFWWPEVQTGPLGPFPLTHILWEFLPWHDAQTGPSWPYLTVR